MASTVLISWHPPASAQGLLMDACVLVSENAKGSKRMTLHNRIMAAHAGLIALLVLALGITPAAAQGTQTGVITGVVSSTDGAPLPGVAVTVTSPSLQGGRTAT